MSDKKLFINMLVKSFKKYLMESFSSEAIQAIKTETGKLTLYKSIKSVYQYENI